LNGGRKASDHDSGGDGPIDAEAAKARLEKTRGDLRTNRVPSKQCRNAIPEKNVRRRRRLEEMDPASKLTFVVCSYGAAALKHMKSGGRIL